MTNNPRPPSRIPLLRKVWKPAAVTGAGASTAAIFFEELILFGEEILGLILLPIMAGIVYLYNVFVFKSSKLKKE